MRFFLSFESDNYGKKQINEPIGFNKVKFSLKQKSDGAGMARDISFSGGSIEFEFTDMRDHELKQLLYYHRKFGFESKVVMIIEIDQNNKYECDLDFATATTDDLTYFKCKGIENSKLQIIKARKKVKVDLMSDKDLDGNFINPLVSQNILLLSKPINQSSKWSSQGNVNFKRTNLVFDVNITNSIDKYGIEQTFAPFPQSETGNKRDFFKIITATNTSRNLNLNTKLKGFISGGGSKTIVLTMIVGTDLATSGLGTVFLNAKEYVLHRQEVSSSDLIFDVNVFQNIPILERNNSVWLFLRVAQPLANELTTVIESSNTSLEIESTAYNSVSKSFRLVDVMKQVVKSISGLDINSPRFNQLGEFYDNRLLNGDLLRGISKNGFKISLEDLENSFPEFKGDFEIGSDGKVFFGIEKDFYTNIQSGFFNNTQFDKMNKTFNPKYSVNEFNYKYKNYQSLKENEEANSADTIHGESRFVFFNKLVENKKDVAIEWTRDAFLIETSRRKALQISQDTASQDDDTIFVVDSVQTDFNNTFTEVTNLQHSYNPVTFKLNVRNDGSINFISLGIEVDSIFTILTPDPNAGTYRVFSVIDNSLELTRVLGIVTALGDGLRQTRYSYTLDPSLVPFTNYTNQGFSETENLNAANSYSNRRYSTARNIYNYWNSYLATCNMYWKNNPIRNTWYKNNGDYTAKYDGVKLTEKADFIPKNPILTPVLYNEIVFKDVDFVDFIQLQTNIRSQRGFIRTIDNNEKVIKIYPVDVEYSILKKELVIKGEEKFEPSSMTISTEFDYILINNETRVLSLKWEFKNEKLFIFDENRFRLYNPVFWMEVSINGAIANSIEQLKEWLSLVD